MLDRQKLLRNKTIIYWGGAALFVVLMWAWFFLEQFTNLRITRIWESAREHPIPLLVPILASIAGVVLALFFWHRAVGLVKNGVEVSATIKDLGVALNGMRNVSYEYEFQGAKYSKKESMSCVLVDNLKPGDPLPILVDPRNPKRMIVVE